MLPMRLIRPTNDPGSSTIATIIRMSWDNAHQTEPKTPGQWLGYIFFAAIALFGVWWMLRLYVL